MSTRRDFLTTSGSAAGGMWLTRFAPLLAATQACASEAMRDELPFNVFTEREGADFDAFAARIVPTDETPGAREAGSVYFADRALEGVLSDLLPIVRAGLEAMNGRVAERYEGAGAFADLSEERQDEIVRAVEQEDPGFFFFAKTLVLLGLVTNPEYGGNRDGIGWRLLGFEDRYAYQPPFGYYDRDEHGTAAAAAGAPEAHGGAPGPDATTHPARAASGPEAEPRADRRGAPRTRKADR